MQWARLLRYGFPCIADPPHTAIATTTPRFKSPSATVSRIIDSTVIPYVVGPMVRRKILWDGVGPMYWRRGCDRGPSSLWGVSPKVPLVMITCQIDDKYLCVGANARWTRDPVLCSCGFDANILDFRPESRHPFFSSIGNRGYRAGAG